MKEHVVQIATAGKMNRTIYALTSKGNLYKGEPTSKDKTHHSWTKMNGPLDEEKKDEGQDE